METLSEHGCYGGTVGFYTHSAAATACDMKFSVFMPPQAKHKPVPVLFYLAGLTCTEETFMTKAGALRTAAELGLALVAPDTSPRGEGVPDDPEGGWDFGLGAGFYLDATEPPWNQHYNMYTYLTRDLSEVVFENFPADADAQGIFGHSMGGHGALTIGLTHPETFKSISAFAPIVAPMQCPWGQKAFTGYLGADTQAWRAHDATEIVKGIAKAPAGLKILIDQGLCDPFLERELHPHLFQEACLEAGLPLDLRRHEGYDHGYYFISTFIEDHLRHHAETLIG